MKQRKIIVIAHNIRSTHNVGSLLRTAEGLGVDKVYLTGYTPYPQAANDPRLPHEIMSLSKRINKTALGAEKTIVWHYYPQLQDVLDRLKAEAVELVALEQTDQAVALHEYSPPRHVALLLGEEVHGVPSSVLGQIRTHVFIPMFGQKESFNVVQAAAMALYEFRFH